MYRSSSPARLRWRSSWRVRRRRPLPSRTSWFPGRPRRQQRLLGRARNRRPQAGPPQRRQRRRCSPATRVRGRGDARRNRGQVRQPRRHLGAFRGAAQAAPGGRPTRLPATTSPARRATGDDPVPRRGRLHDCGPAPRAGAYGCCTPAAGCRGTCALAPTPAERSQIALTLLAATQRSPGRRLSFEALGLEEIGAQRGEADLDPGPAGPRGPLRARRAGSRSGARRCCSSKKGILLSEAKIHPTQITVGLPPPFSGTADFREVPGSAPTWVGDFTVSFPGARRVPLTGPGFQVGFCRTVSKRAFERCARPFEEALTTAPRQQTGPGSGAAQLSGSQSQAFGTSGLLVEVAAELSSSAGSTLYMCSGSGKWRRRTSSP